MMREIAFLVDLNRKNKEITLKNAHFSPFSCIDNSKLSPYSIQKHLPEENAFSRIWIKSNTLYKQIIVIWSLFYNRLLMISIWLSLSIKDFIQLLNYYRSAFLCRKTGI